MTYKRPERLALLTDEQLEQLHRQDIKYQDEYNKKYDPDYNLDSFTRKWHSRMSDASYDWQLLNRITLEQLYEVIYWLSNNKEPYNESGCGRPGKIKELARDIKYSMSSKQRAVAYSIITKRFNTTIKE